MLLILPVEVPIETEWSITCGGTLFKYTSNYVTASDGKLIQPLSLSLSSAVPPPGSFRRQQQHRPSRGNSRLPVLEKGKEESCCWSCCHLAVGECYRQCYFLFLYFLHSLSIRVRCLSLPFTFHQLVEHVHRVATLLISPWALSGRAHLVIAASTGHCRHEANHRQRSESEIHTLLLPLHFLTIQQQYAVWPLLILPLTRQLGAIQAVFVDAALGEDARSCPRWKTTIR